MPVDTTNSIPPVEQFGLEPGARTPAESAQMKTMNAANEQNANNQQAGSKRRRKYKGGRGDQPGPNEIVVPQPTVLAEPAGPVDANANTAKGTETLTNSAAQSEFDGQVGKGGGKGGGKKYRKSKQKYQIGCSSKRRGGNKRATKRRKGSKRKHYSSKRRGGVLKTRRRKRRYTKKRR